MAKQVLQSHQSQNLEQFLLSLSRTARATSGNNNNINDKLNVLNGQKNIDDQHARNPFNNPNQQIDEQQ